MRTLATARASPSSPTAAPPCPASRRRGRTRRSPRPRPRPASRPPMEWREAPTTRLGKERLTSPTGRPSSGSCTPCAPATTATSGRPFTSTRAAVPAAAATTAATSARRAPPSRSFSRTWMMSTPARAALRRGREGSGPRAGAVTVGHERQDDLRGGHEVPPGTGAPPGRRGRGSTSPRPVTAPRVKTCRTTARSKELG